MEVLGGDPEVASLLAKLEGAAALRLDSIFWLQSLFGQELPPLNLEEILQNGWVLGRVAEIVGALRQGKSARLSAGEVLSQLRSERPKRAMLADLEAYYKLFDDLHIQRDNLFSLDDLVAGANTIAVCRSLWDLAAALHQLGVQGVPEFEGCDLRRSTSMTRNNSIKAARLESLSSPQPSPKPALESPTWHPAKEGAGSPWRIVSLTAVAGGEPAGQEMSPGCASSSATNFQPSGSRREAAASPTADSPDVVSGQAAGRRTAGPGLAKLGPLTISPVSDAGSINSAANSPSKIALTPGRLETLSLPNPAYSPGAPSGRGTGPTAAAAATPAPAGAPAGAAAAEGEVTPGGPLQFKLSPPSGSEGPSPEGGFLATLVSEEKPGHVHLINALLFSAPPPTAGRAAAAPERAYAAAAGAGGPAAGVAEEPGRVKPGGFSTETEGEQAAAGGGWGGRSGRPIPLRMLLVGLAVGAGLVATAAGVARAGRRRGGSRAGARSVKSLPPHLRGPRPGSPSWDSPALLLREGMWGREAAAEK